MKSTNIGETEQFKNFSNEFEKNLIFLDDFSSHIKFSGRRIIFLSENKIHFLNQNLIDNSIQTLKSIKLCCSIGSFTDANTLIRKYRDDLILYVFILDVIKKRKPFIESDIENLDIKNVENFTSTFSNIRFNPDLTENEQAVKAWLTNRVLELPRNIKFRLSFENYMKSLKQNINVEEILDNYKLQEYWETLRNRLNNYVHNNGNQFTSHNLITSNNENLDIFLKNVNIRTSYITTFFLILITMIDSTLFSSSDYSDYLDCGLEPPEDCQYEISNFIQNYIDKEVVKLHPELKQYLIDNNSYGMKIN